MAADPDLTMRERLFEALLRGENHSQAARSSGYSRKHVKDLVKQPAFSRELEKRLEAQAKATPAQAPDPDEELALEHLRDIVADLDQPGTARVAAAKELRAAAKDRRAPKASTTSQPAGAEDGPVRSPKSVAEQAAKYGIKVS